MPHLTSLRAENFRCFDRLHCAFDAGTTVFVGENAQGKTSILEALCVLLRLQSPRTSTLADLARFGQSNGFGLAGDLIPAPPENPPSADRPPTSDLRPPTSDLRPPTADLRPPTADRRPPTSDPIPLKFRWHDGQRQLSAAGLADLTPSRYLAHSTLLVWMGNDDLSLVRGSSEGRRRYLDFLGSQAFPAYRPAWLAYDKALRARNRLLKDDRPDPRLLAAYTTPLLEHGTILTRLRAELVDALSPWAAAAHQDICGSPTESLELHYSPGATSDFPAALAASAPEESRRRLTVVGPHRDDLALVLNHHPAATFASEGQQRTLALALKLAQARLLQALHHLPPLLLLDDIFGELDPRRRNALLASLPPNSQQFITTTHLDWTSPSFSPHRLYSVHQGSVSTL